MLISNDHTIVSGHFLRGSDGYFEVLNKSNILKTFFKPLRKWIWISYLFLSFAKNVSGTQIFSAKSPERVRTLSSSGLKESHFLRGSDGYFEVLNKSILKTFFKPLRKWIWISYLFLSFAKNVSGTQIFSAKSPERVRTLSSSGLKESLSSFQYWFKYIVIV